MPTCFGLLLPLVFGALLVFLLRTLQWRQIFFFQKAAGTAQAVLAGAMSIQLKIVLIYHRLILLFILRLQERANAARIGLVRVLLLPLHASQIVITLLRLASHLRNVLHLVLNLLQLVKNTALNCCALQLQALQLSIFYGASLETRLRT